jgi:hypothetical protein
VKDNVQVYNIPKFDGFHKRAQPKVLQGHIAEIEQFSRVSICHAKTPVRLGPQYAKLPSCILSFTPSFLLRNQASILIFSSYSNKDTILLLRSITRPRSSYVIVFDTCCNLAAKELISKGHP